MRTTHRRWRTPARAAILLALAALALLASSAPASAAPSEPTLSLAELQAKLEAGPVAGFMKTTVKGYTIDQIPVTVEGVAEFDWGSLILARASGPVIDAAGGTADGMSGSPVYVDDGGVDKLVGALSYGADFTTGGMFLATPIEYMAAVEADYPVKPPAPGAYKLAEPLETSAGRVSSVIVARSQRSAKAIDPGAGQIVIAPKGLIQIGGLAPQSRAYKELAAKLEKRTGLRVVSAAGGGFWTGPPAPPLEAGSSVYYTFSLGAAWYGGYGTVTYVNGDVVMAFGHPGFWTGPCGGAMLAGSVTGIWPSQWAPFVLSAPRDIKGTFTQDRNWGTAGVVGQDPDMIPVDAHVTFPEEGRDVTTHSEAAEWAFQSEFYSDVPGFLVLQALWNACDAFVLPGSAETLTTIVVSDETGTYTVEFDNLWDSFDITWDPAMDVLDALWTLASDPDGVLDTRLESVDFQATVSSQRRSARLVDIVLAEPLHTGDNTVQVTYYGYGSRDLKTLSATLSIPAGKPVEGEIDVTPAYWGYWYGGDGSDDPSPATLEDIVDGLNSRPKNSDLLLTFYPRKEGEWRPPDDSSAPAVKSAEPYGDDTTYDPVKVTVPTDWVFDGWLLRSTIPVTLDARPARLDFGQRALLQGEVMGLKADVPVSIYRVDAATGVETFVETVTAVYGEGEQPAASFVAFVKPTPHHTTFVARVGAVDHYLPGSADDKVKVRAAVRLSAAVSGLRVALKARVRPADTGGKVAFQRYANGRWQTVKTVKVPASGAPTFGWTAPKAGSYRWRARFLGSILNLAKTSAVRTVTVE